MAQLTVASIRRGVECGLTSEVIIDFLSKRATKGVPQTVTHFIRDVAGQYGQIELGPAEVYLKAATPELLAELLSTRAIQGLVRPLTDTVAVLAE
ncbi:MAG: helicase-associated domain-containing protein, partial [Chloroflexota bacterium]